MTRDEIVRAVVGFGPIALLAVAAWLYGIHYRRTEAREDAKEKKAASH